MQPTNPNENHTVEQERIKLDVMICDFFDNLEHAGVFSCQVLWIFPLWHSQTTTCQSNRSSPSLYVTTNAFILKYHQTVTKQMHRSSQYEGRSEFTKSFLTHPGLSSYFCPTKTVIRASSIFAWCQLSSGQNVTILIWELNLIYSLVLLKYLRRPEALTASLW